MENMEKYFNKLSAVFVVIGTFVSSTFKTMPQTLQALVFFGSMDYILGLLIAGTNKEINSRKALKGFIRKMFNVLIIAMSYVLDNLMGLKGVMWSASIWFFISYEAISILEHGNTLGFNYPSFLKTFLERIYNHNDTLTLSNEWKPNPDTIIGYSDSKTSPTTQKVSSNEDLKEFISTLIDERNDVK